MTIELWHVGAAMALPLAGLLVAELRGDRRWLLVCKPVASALFVAAGALFLPRAQGASMLLFAGLLLSFVGDALLIPKGRRLSFLAGLACFLCAHGAYCIAFVLKGTDTRAVTVGAAALVLAGVPLARWLFPHVDGPMRVPVVAYVVTITAMVTLACGAWQGGARITLVIGAVLFYASDVCVARERFVQRALVNGIVGLPLYYAAQLLLVDGLR